jgi:hypothetical protein
MPSKPWGLKVVEDRIAELSKHIGIDEADLKFRKEHLAELEDLAKKIRDGRTEEDF